MLPVRVSEGAVVFDGGGDDAGDAEVEEFDALDAVGGAGEHDVVGFEVAVDDVVGVGFGQSGGDLGGDQ